jgi:hypothetical protein
MRIFVIVWLACVTSLAHADTIAMLPLDGEKRLEIYGQPVASEIARALKADGLDVVVVGARMDVPDRAQLIVDGTIKMGKGKEITLSIRVRDPRDGTVLETLPAPATSLDNLDKAAADLSARIVPRVKVHLAAIAKPAVADKPPVDTKLSPPRPPTPRTPTLDVQVYAQRPEVQQLKLALDGQLPAWLPRQHFATTVKLTVLGFSVDRGNVPMARARVRVEIGGTKFNRVVRTDTIVGDRDSTDDQLAARTAREVLAILVPHLRRALPVR